VKASKISTDHLRAMQKNDADELRSKAREYRERADRELHDPVITEAFYQIAATLERRAVMREAAVLDVQLHEALARTRE
jgi:hypothetical protein